MARHNELCDGLADLDGKAFTPTHVRDNPLILSGCAVKRQKTKETSSKAIESTSDTAATPPLESMEHTCDLLICDL